jgi:hypothetical protein
VFPGGNGAARRRRAAIHVELHRHDAQPTAEFVSDTLLMADHAQAGRKGWPMIFSGLKSLFEIGRALNIPVPQPPRELGR